MAYLVAWQFPQRGNSSLLTQSRFAVDGAVSYKLLPSEFIGA